MTDPAAADHRPLRRGDAAANAVLSDARAGVPTARDMSDLDERSASFGDRAADRVAAIGGSWGFIIVFAIVLAGWMLLNTDVLVHWGLEFDPYPYVFLNLMLSTLAAIQAPVIMMSQNRQAAKDRMVATNDYAVNLRAEIEIRRLHERLDAIHAQNAALLHRIDGGAP